MYNNACAHLIAVMYSERVLYQEKLSLALL